MTGLMLDAFDNGVFRDTVIPNGFGLNNYMHWGDNETLSPNYVVIVTV